MLLNLCYYKSIINIYVFQVITLFCYFFFSFSLSNYAIIACSIFQYIYLFIWTVLHSCTILRFVAHIFCDFFYIFFPIQLKLGIIIIIIIQARHLWGTAGWAILFNNSYISLVFIKYQMYLISCFMLIIHEIYYYN
jgi:hypothetical protein